MSRRRARIAHSDEAGVNMTPMLDIVFILLIFFIVTSVFINERGLDFTQARGVVPPGPASAVVAITIDSESRIAVEGRIVPVSLVEAEVQRYLVDRPDAAIDLRAAEDARLEQVVAVKDRMELAGRSVRFETYAPAIATAGLN